MWKIIPLDLGIIEVARSSNIMIANSRAGEIVPNTSIAWLLINENDGRKVLIDTGAVEDVEWSRKYHVPCIREREDQYLVPALAKYGVKPEDIEYIVLTHLHWDHAYGLDKIPQAKIYVQRKELLHAVSQNRYDAKIYESNIPGKVPFFLNAYDRMIFLDGDAEIDEGLQVLFLPGHSPGSQGVIIETKQGRYIIAGDLINTSENWEKRIPCGLHLDVQSCYDSFEKIAQTGATVLPAHDYTAFDLLK